ncbi:DUF2178 domain-containing protein [Candidatus Micrarchaeota archaeon]|nr:DUF2178 domain-containing protein [Candidatus Micrarchaeota archaeon]
MKLQNVVISAGFTFLLYQIYVSRSTFEPAVFAVLLFGLLIAGGLFLWRDVLRGEKIKHDERTELLAGKAARITLIAAFATILLITAVLTITERPTSPIGVLVMLVGLLTMIYSITTAYLETTR